MMLTSWVCDNVLGMKNWLRVWVVGSLLLLAGMLALAQTTKVPQPVGLSRTKCNHPFTVLKSNKYTTISAYLDSNKTQLRDYTFTFEPKFFDQESGFTYEQNSPGFAHYEHTVLCYQNQSIFLSEITISGNRFDENRYYSSPSRFGPIVNNSAKIITSQESYTSLFKYWDDGRSSRATYEFQCETYPRIILKSEGKSYDLLKVGCSTLSSSGDIRVTSYNVSWYLRDFGHIKSMSFSRAGFPYYILTTNGIPEKLLYQLGHNGYNQLPQELRNCP
jgi:hypothetical protein